MASQNPYTYDDLVNFSGETNKGELRIRPNTVAVAEEDAYYVWLYGTLIATLYSDGRVRVDRRGFDSLTTRNRLNDVLIPLGWRIVVRKDRWYVDTVEQPRRSMEFVDNMIVTRINKTSKEN